jgi:hypothetical protein
LIVIVPFTFLIVMPIPDTESREPPSMETFEMVTDEPPVLTMGALDGRPPKDGSERDLGVAVGAGAVVGVAEGAVVGVGEGAAVGVADGTAVGAGDGAAVGVGAKLFATVTVDVALAVAPTESVALAVRSCLPSLIVLVSSRPSGSPRY